MIKIGKQHISDSSDEVVDTSDGTIDPSVNDLVNQFAEASRKRCGAVENEEVASDPVHGSKRLQWEDEQHQERRMVTPREKVEQLVRAAERAKARVLDVPGRDKINHGEGKLGGHLVHSVLVDEEYSAIASHIDEGLKRKIIAGEYIDFVKLLPRDRIIEEEDQCLKMVNRGSLSYWVPVGDKSLSISSVHRWDQAFRVFTKIYLEGSNNQGRAAELIQYSHIIHEANIEFPWESVYAYDREFRVHMSKYLTRSWGIILQQAWTLKMCRQSGRATHGGRGSAAGNDKSARKKYLLEV